MYTRKMAKGRSNQSVPSLLDKASIVGGSKMAAHNMGPSRILPGQEHCEINGMNHLDLPRPVHDMANGPPYDTTVAT